MWEISFLSIKYEIVVQRQKNVFDWNVMKIFFLVGGKGGAGGGAGGGSGGGAGAGAQSGGKIYVT